MEVNLTLVYKPDKFQDKHYTPCRDSMNILFKIINLNATSISHLTPTNCKNSLGDGNAAYESGFKCTVGKQTQVEGAERCCK